MAVAPAEGAGRVALLAAVDPAGLVVDGVAVAEGATAEVGTAVACTPSSCATEIALTPLHDPPPPFRTVQREPEILTSALS